MHGYRQEQMLHSKSGSKFTDPADPFVPIGRVRRGGKSRDPFFTDATISTSDPEFAIAAA